MMTSPVLLNVIVKIRMKKGGMPNHENSIYETN